MSNLADVDVHSVVDDHSRVAYAEIFGDDCADTRTGFVGPALELFAADGIDRVVPLFTGNAWSYRHGTQVSQFLADHNIEQKFTRPHSPWHTGKVEHFCQALASEWAYRQVFTDNTERYKALTEFIHCHNQRRRHNALDGQAPITHLSPT